jgi:hypothetical protein
MPYTHWKALSNPSAMMKTSLEDTIYNIDYGQTSYTPGLDISHNGVSVFSGSTFASTLSAQTYIPFSIPINYTFDNTYPEDTADFLVKSFFSQTGIESNSYNDTSFYYQKFRNYYAYDDGSAEAHFALSGSAEVSLAVKYDVKMQDTLRGVQIYFNPSGENIANKLFQLTVWSNIDIATSAETELYREINQKPDSFDGINAFKTFLFNSTIVVGPGPIWVGFIQNDAQQLFGVGFDRNTDTHDKLVVRYAGSWVQSNIPGSIMVRPLFGKRIPGVGIDETLAENPVFSVYPNPAGDKFLLDFENAAQTTYTYSIYNSLGTIVKEQNVSQPGIVDISDLSSGIYFVRLQNEKTKSSSVQKLVVN